MARRSETEAGDRRRHTVVTITLFCLLAGLFLWPVITRGASFTTMGGVGDNSLPWFTGNAAHVPVQADQAVLSAPWQAELTRAVQDGTLPLWGEQFGGMPLFSNGASGQLYPPRLVIAALGLSPLRAHDAFSAMHLVGAGIAAYLLLRELRLGRLAARFGGAAWMLCGFSTAWLHFEVLTPVLVLLPLSMWAVRRCVRLGRTPSVLTAGAILAVTLTAGQMPFMALTVFVALADGMLSAMALGYRRGGDGWRTAVRTLARPVVAGMIAVGAAAVVLVPTAATLSTGNRDAIGFDQLDDPWLPTGKPLTLDARTLTDVIVPSTEQLSVASINHGQIFAGTITAGLALVGAFIRRRGQSLGLALVVVTTALTVGGPLTWLAFHVNPLFQYFRPYGRATYLIALGVVVLGALGLDAVLRVLRPAADDPVVSPRRLRPGPAVAWAVLAVTSVQLLVHGHDLNPTFVDPGEQAMGSTPFVEAVADQQRSDAWPARMMSTAGAAAFGGQLPGNTAGLFGVDTLNGYDSSVPSRTITVARHLDGQPYEAASQPLQLPYLTGNAVRVDLAERLGVRTFGTPPGAVPAIPLGPDGEPRQLEVEYAGTDGSLFRITDAADPIRVVFDVVEADDEADAFGRFFDPAFDWVDSVVVERDDVAVAGVSSLIGNPPVDHGASAAAVDVGVNTVTVRVDTDESGILVVPNNWDAGWEASIDGVAVDVVRANYNQIAVPVPAGTGHVHLRYVPTGLRAGAVATAATLGLCLVAAGIHVLRRRRTDTRPAAGDIDDVERADGRCAWCHADLDVTTDDGPVVRCDECGAGTTHPWPDDATLDAAYADWYRPAAGRFSLVGDAVLRRTRGRLAGRIDDIAPAGPVLDIGSGDGTLVDALEKVGRTGLGVERLDTTDGDPLDGHGANRFAAVVLWHSLEHLRNPTETLASIRRHLVPGGVIVIAIPNFESVQARVFGDDWFALDVPRHLVHIPASTLRHRLDELGFSVERTSHVRGGQVVFGWLDGLVGRLSPRLDLYGAIRRSEAREQAMSSGDRTAALLAGVALLPVAAVAAGVEVALRRGGTFYVEARFSGGEAGASEPAG